MKRRVLACISVVFLCIFTVAQSSDMDHWLKTGTEQQRVKKLLDLGVDREAAGIAPTDESEWRAMRTESRQRFAILFLPCGALSSSSLHLLRWDGGRWRVIDSVGFDCHYDDSVSIQTAALRSQEFDDVLVHHECESHGTGFVQQNFNVYAIRSGKLRLMLNREEVVNADPYSPGTKALKQRSRFKALAATETDSGKIEETRCSTVNGKVKIQTRDFRWSNLRHRFVASEFTTVTLSDETRKVCR